MLEQILENPASLEGRAQSFLNGIQNPENWVRGTLSQGTNAGRGLKLSEVLPGGRVTGAQIRYNPTARHHPEFGDKGYWIINNGRGMKVRVVGQ